jgi:signal transduction histidine kinase
VTAAVAGEEEVAEVFWKNPVPARRQPLPLRAQLFSDLLPTQLKEVTGSQPRAEALARLNLTSFIRVEVAARGKVLGTILFGARDERKRFQPADAYFIEDVAYRVAAAIDNALLYHEAQTAVRVRDEFLAIASHELRTPLTPLKLHAQQLMRSIKKRGLAGLSQESLQRMVNTTNRQVERLAKLIDSLLDITRISRGKLTLTPTDFILGDMVQEVVARLGGDLELAGCTLELNVDNTIRVRWDSFRMDQVVENLLSNAIKYARGKPIEMKAWQDNDGVHISVRDHGIGISTEDQKRIFRRFERAVSSSHFGGLGLGLYIVSQILDAHKGSISVESVLGQGSLFTVTLPAELPVQVENLSGSAAS